MEKLRVYIKRNSFRHFGGVLSATGRPPLEGDDTSIKEPLLDDGIHKRFKPTLYVFIGYRRHPFSLLSQHASCEESNR